MLDHSHGEENLHGEGFVPATQWNELRQKFGTEPSQMRGFRSLTAAMQSENPELTGSRKEPLQLQNSARTKWLPEPIGLQADAIIESQTQSTVAGGHTDGADVDVCFASERFMENLEWSLQTIEIRSDAEFQDPIDADQELGLMEAVHDLSRIVARSTARRVERRIAD